MVEGEQELEWCAERLKGRLIERLATEPKTGPLDVRLADLTIGQLLIVTHEVLRVALEAEARNGR